MAPHSSTLAWRIPWMEEPGRLQTMRSWRVKHGWLTSLSLSTFMPWRRKWQPTPVFLPGESQGGGEPGGLLYMGLHRVGHDWSDLAAAANKGKASHTHLLKYLRLFRWQYSPDWSSNSMQPLKKSVFFFSKIWQVDPKMSTLRWVPKMSTHETQNQNDLEKDEQSWYTHTFHF